jgi:type I restriction enzyme M protein
MSDEQEGGPVPPEYGWRSLEGLNSDAVREQYARILAALSERAGMLAWAMPTGSMVRSARAT